MPVIIKPNDFERWLDCKTCEPRDVNDLMNAVEDDFFEAIAVSDRVNKVANTGPDVQESGVAEAVAPKAAKKKQKPETTQMDLF